MGSKTGEQTCNTIVLQLGHRHAYTQSHRCPFFFRGGEVVHIWLYSFHPNHLNYFFICGFSDAMHCPETMTSSWFHICISMQGCTGILIASDISDGISIISIITRSLKTCRLKRRTTSRCIYKPHQVKQEHHQVERTTWLKGTRWFEGRRNHPAGGLGGGQRAPPLLFFIHLFLKAPCLHLVHAQPSPLQAPSLRIFL